MMNDGRLILILDNDHHPASKEALGDLWKSFPVGDKPTFALGLVQDVTLSLTSRFPSRIYNAFEYFPLTEESIWQMLCVTEVYTVLRGHVWPARHFDGVYPKVDMPALLPKTAA